GLGSDIQFCAHEVWRKGHHRYHRACLLLWHHRNGTNYSQRADCPRRRAEVADGCACIPEVTVACTCRRQSRESGECNWQLRGARNEDKNRFGDYCVLVYLGDWGRTAGAKSNCSSASAQLQVQRSRDSTECCKL